MTRNAGALPLKHQLALVTASAIPLITFYAIGDVENVFYQPLSLTGGALGLVALTATVLVGGHWLRTGMPLVAGALLATTAFVFTVGPGNLWPIAIALGTLAAALPIGVGVALGAFVRTLEARRK